MARLSELSGGDLVGTRTLCDEAWRRHRTLGHIAGPAVTALVLQGFAASLLGDFDQAVDCTEECARITRAHGEQSTPP